MFWSFRHLCRLAPLLGLAAVFCLPAYADTTLGAGARAAAMGGAGLAADDTPDAAVRNPALLANNGLGFGLVMPTITTQLNGAGYSDVFSLLARPSLGAADALDLAKHLGTQTTDFSASASTGVELFKADLLATATMRTEIVPNDAFKSWANGSSSTPALDARADVYTAGIVNLPSLGMGFHLPLGKQSGRVSVGMRIKPTQAYYSHYIIDSAAVIAGNGARPAEEMSGSDYLKQTSVSADLGLMYTPRSIPSARVALVVNNAIEPKAIALGPGAPDGATQRQLSPRSFSIGTALVQSRYTLAADLVDLTGAYGPKQLRLGAEWRLPAGLALRGGYNTAAGVSAGIGLGSLGLAYSKNTPVMLTQSIAF
ncbi:MAG: hypothetical protein ACYDBB_05510 [Armatimonadota bacterium]